MDEDDLAPVTIFSGAYAEVLFLKSLIEAAGIPTNLVMPQRFGDPFLTVRRFDASHAQELADDFRQHGKRTE